MINRLAFQRLRALPSGFVGLLALYFATSLGHFTHNAEFICEYPNLPVWLTRAKVYAAWLAITAVGALGLAALIYLRQSRAAIGLMLIAAYAALGFDGLGHYAVAPMALHTWGANLTILSEVAAAAMLLAATLYLLWRELAKVRHSLKESPHAQQ